MIRSIDLVESLLEKTRSGKLIWSELGANSFQAMISENSVTIERRRGGDFVLTFRNADGVAVETLAARDQTFTEPEILTGEAYIMVKDLYELVRRQALRADEFLREIKRKLDML
jgi:hypothetical protein